jgi:putative phage-type endonuclease
VDVTEALDMSMLDASAWQEPRESETEAPWIDATPGPYSACAGTPYLDTGARSHIRQGWLRARRTGIGASEIAAILGESRWGDAGTVYARKVALPDDAEGEWLEWGLRLEPVILEAYSSARYAGRYATRDGRLLRSREHPWALCTLDAWTALDGMLDALIPLELKTDRWGREWDDGPPVEYLWQLQHQMLVTGAARASIAVLVGGSQLAWCDVAREETMIARIIRAGERFWRQVEAREMPETRDHAALGAVFAEADRGRVVELEGVEWAARDAKRCEAAAVASTATAEKSAIDAEIKRAMGRAEVARLDDGTEYTWQARRDGVRVLRRKEAVIR